MRGKVIPVVRFGRVAGGATLPLTSHLKLLYLSHLSKPASDRLVYQLIRRQRIRKILELGVGTGRRALKMIEVARLCAPKSEVHYTGVDLFEARTGGAGSGLTVKSAHRLLKPTGARVRLLPGDPLSALSRAANTLGGTELILISVGNSLASLAPAWFYVPRMLAPSCRVLIEERSGPEGELQFRRMGRDEIERLAAAATVRRAA